MTAIFWFKQDLRLSDNPGINEASRVGKILPIYIWSDMTRQDFKTGKASQVYLHYSLESLNHSLDDNLNFYKGDAKKILRDLLHRHHITHVFWSRCDEPWNRVQDAEIQTMLTESNVKWGVFNSSYLWEPEEIKNEEGSYYKVFSAYKRKAYLVKPRKPCAKPDNLHLIKDITHSLRLQDMNFLSDHPWERTIHKYWDFGEKAALRKLDDFLNHGLVGYKTGRDYPGAPHTSRLSVNLHFGEISPYHIWDKVQHVDPVLFPQEDRDHFLSELVWREFSRYLLTHFTGLASDNFHRKFQAFPWQYNDTLVRAWTKGRTGYPLVDAGMRELWETGYMHNRVRMIVASFLVKNLMIHWHCGRDWFWDCLVDADLANNSASWQWVAGCGADAAPYFRVFNPVTQGAKFDPQGMYTRKFIPELRTLPDKYLFAPWTAPQEVLKASGVFLGDNYPYPIVDLEKSRNAALAAYKNL